jgi:hypothetical protein
MPPATAPNRPETDELLELQRQLQRYSTGIAEFKAMAAELKMKRLDARVADMIRLNRETIGAMQRSAELVEHRLKLLEARTAAVHRDN